MRFSLVLFLLFASACGTPSAGLTPSAEAKAHALFDKILEMRRTAYAQYEQVRRLDGQQPARRAWEGKAETCLRLQGKLTKHLRQYPESDVYVEGYRNVLLTELESPSAERRGLACELLSRSPFDMRVVEAFSRHLDDDGETGPWLGWLGDGGQAVASSLRLRMAPPFPVKRWANSGLRSMTRISFHSRQSFDIWWRANRNYRQSVWYWTARWAYPGSVSRDFSILRRMNKETALRILLLSMNDRARQAELDCSLGIRPTDGLLKTSPIAPRFPHPASVEPAGVWEPERYAAVAALVKERGLQARLIELLTRRNVYPEASGLVAHEQLVVDICGVGRLVLSPKDEPVLAQAQSLLEASKRPGQPGRLGHPGYAPTEGVRAIALLRAELAPAHAAEILAATVERNPGIGKALTSDLVTRLGCVKPELVKRYFCARVAEAISVAAKKGLPVDRLLLAELAEQVQRPSSIPELRSLAAAAQAVLGRPALAPEEIPKLPKTKLKLGYQEWLAGVDNDPDLLKQLAAARAKLIAELKSS